MLGETELAGDIYGTRDVNVPGLMDNFERAVGSVANAVTERFGTSLEKDYVVGLDQGFIGEVTEDYSVADALGNLVGMAVPGGAQVDSARAKSLRTSDPRELEYQYSSTLFGQHSSLQTAEELAASRAAAAAQAEKERQMGGGQAPFTAAAVPAAVLMEAASRGARSQILGNFLRATAPSIYPQIYQMFNEGGKAEQPQAQVPEEQVEMMMAMPPMKEIAADPQKFLKDPNSARTAEETQNIYRYNKQVLDLAKTLPKPTLAVEGGVQGQEPKVAEGGPAGFVGQAPEQLDEATTVADDVPMEVAEGTFVINAAAVEHAGSDDIKKMILTAMDEARNQGIDTSGNVNTIDRENAVSLLVSRGEVIVPPLLAKIIGYDRLNKINNRGKEEVKKRVEENGQSPEAEALDQQPQNPAEGMTMEDGGVAVRGSGSTGPDQKNVNLEAEVQGEGFIAKPRLNYSEQTNTQQFPDGVVVDEKGKSLGFAVDGQMFLKDDKSLRAGFERQASNFEGQVNLPEQYDGETIEFGGGSKMKRYNMGATFGPVDVDLSKTQVPTGDDVLGGSVRYRFSENGDVTLEATDDGRSGRIGLNYRF